MEELKKVSGKITNLLNNTNKFFFASFNINTPLYKIDEFVNKFREETNKKYEFFVDVKLSKSGHKVFIARCSKKC